MRNRIVVGCIAVAAVAALLPMQTAGAVDPIALFSFRGQVTDAWNRPVVGASVTDGTKTATTDEFGRYKLDETRFGEFRLSASKLPSMATSAAVVKRVDLPTDDTSASFQLLYTATAVINRPYLSTVEGSASAVLTVDTHAPLPGFSGVAGASCVYVRDSRTGVEETAAYVAGNGDGSQRWRYSMMLPAGSSERGDALTSVTRDCSSGVVLSSSAATAYTVDNTVPQAEANDLFPHNNTNAAVALPHLAARVYDRNPVDHSSIAFTLIDETAGSTRTISGTSATRYNAATMWAKTTSGQSLVDGHVYRLRLRVKDAAGNETTVEQPAVSAGGGFLASTITVPVPPAAQIAEHACSVRQPDAAKGETMASVECVDVPVDFGAANVRVAASKGAGSVPVELSVPLATAVIRYGAGGALSEANTSVKSSQANARTTATGIVPSSSMADYTAGGTRSLVSKITASIPPAFTTATVVMPPVSTVATLSGCADVTAAFDMTCHPDHVVPNAVTTRERHVRMSLEWDSLTGAYKANGVTVTDKDTFPDGSVVQTSHAGSDGGTQAGGTTYGSNGCESADPGRIDSDTPRIVSSGPSSSFKIASFAWAIYDFFKDDGRTYNEEAFDVADICYTGWHNPGDGYRITNSGATVGVYAPGSALIGGGGGAGQTKDPTIGTLSVELDTGPVKITGSLNQSSVSRVRNEAGPGPAEVEWPFVDASQMHSAWWEYRCSGLTLACMWNYQGSSSSQGNVGHALYRMDREWYDWTSPPAVQFDNYMKIHCETEMWGIGVVPDLECLEVEEGYVIGG